MKSRTSSVISSVLSPLLVALLLQGCAAPGDELGELGEVRSEEEAQAINEYVDGLGKLEVKDPIEEATEVQPEQPGESLGGAPIVCSVREVHKIENFDRFAVQGGAIADRIYAGAILDANSLGNSVFNEIPLNKKPLTVSIDLPQQTVKTVMPNPSRSDFQEAQRELILAGLQERATPALPKFIDFQEIAVQNEDQLSLTLGFDVKAGVANQVDVAGQFSFNTENKRSRYLVRIVNELYTMTIDKPSFASDFLADNVSLENVQSALRNGNVPVYVDTITFGRIIYLAVESNFSATEVAAALQASFKNGALEANLDFGLTARQVLDETTISAVALGPIDGDAQDIADLRGKDFDAISRMIARQASVTENFFGQPVAFTVAYLADSTQTLNSVEGIFTAESCNPPRNFKVKVNQMNIFGVNDGDLTPNRAEMRGTIAVSYKGKRVFLFNRAAGQEVHLFAGPVSGSNSFFLSGNLSDIDIRAGETLDVEFSLVENDGIGADDPQIQTIPVPVEQILDGELKVPFGVDANGNPLANTSIHGELFIGFQPLFGNGGLGGLFGSFSGLP